MTVYSIDLGLVHLTATATASESAAMAWSARPLARGDCASASVDGCWLVTGQVVVETLGSPLRVDVTLTAAQRPARFESAHGQWLHAAEGRIGRGTIAIGTGDSEWLATHASKPAAMLASDLSDTAVTLRITLPQAVVNQGSTLQFAVAWVDDWAGKADLEVAPWLALGAALNLPEVSA